MDAIRLHAFGPPENLVLDQVPDPVPGPGQVRVAVRAHGVHLLDTALRRGEVAGPLPLPTLPTVPGREVAGVVDVVGPGVDAAWRGRRVAAHLGATPDGGGYARLAVVPVEALHRIPDHVTAPDALAMIGTGRTAVGILDLAGLAATDTVVVTAAAGGLGTLLVQSALAAGARVVAPTGRLVLYGWASGAPNRAGDVDHPDGKTGAHGGTPDVRWAVGHRARPWGDLSALQERALALAADGTWRVVTHQIPLAEAARAHRELEARATTGKVVLV
ncbi:alcohol dehydrogenase catalytic domain-containing protein [Cellulosimicrobium funkei]|uniref:alcohol dehydrogenase catalytic domain-containing protein n=1 Tax=Cellulosimicrobium funkei TaxID=264251 RepID=UPI003D70E8CC